MIRTQDEDYAQKRLGVPVELSPFISFGSDLTKFHPDAGIRREMREKLSIGNDRFVVIVTGKLNEGKGGMLLANAFKKAFDTDKGV